MQSPDHATIDEYERTIARLTTERDRYQSLVNSGYGKEPYTDRHPRAADNAEMLWGAEFNLNRTQNMLTEVLTIDFFLLQASREEKYLAYLHKMNAPDWKLKEAKTLYQETLELIKNEVRNSKPLYVQVTPINVYEHVKLPGASTNYS